MDHRRRNRRHFGIAVVRIVDTEDLPVELGADTFRARFRKTVNFQAAATTIRALMFCLRRLAQLVGVRSDERAGTRFRHVIQEAVDKLRAGGRSKR